MATRSGSAIWAGWAAPQTCRPLTVRRRKLPRPPCYLSTTTFPPCPGNCTSTSHKNGALPAAATEAETEGEVLLESPGHFRIYKCGKMDRLNEPTVSPAGLDEATGVTSRDVVLDADTGVSVRLYLPKLRQPSEKLPRERGDRGGASGGAHVQRDDLVVHVPGGGGRRGRPEDQPAGARRVVAGAASVREDAGVRGGEVRETRPLTARGNSHAEPQRSRHPTIQLVRGVDYF
uniref:Uncharacterized protein n=1 Tax=Aegilops tauschii TaxID=37682 RepID=M8BZH2_AEGTA